MNRRMIHPAAPGTLWVLTLAAAAACRADIPSPHGGGGARPHPRPLPPAAAGAPFQIVSLPLGQPARLEIPRRLLPTAHAAAGLDEPGAAAGALGSSQLIGSGLALSL